MNRALLRAFVFILTKSLFGTDYYIDPAGNNANPGTLALPWQSIAAVNAATFAPGDHIYFQGGVTFTGSVQLSQADSGAAGNPLVLGSYGSGRAIISASSSQNAIKIQDGEHMVIQDLCVHGPGGGTAYGIWIKGNGSANRHDIVIRNCEAYGFGDTGLFFTAGSATTGYHDVSVTACDFHDNQGCGVDFDSANWTAMPHPNGNFYFGQCRFYNNLATGLLIVETSGALVEYCQAYNNGPSSGCIGFWCWDSDHIVIQYCESHHNHRCDPNTCSDGGGFDLDGATQDSILQYNYSHDNDGGGLALYQFAWASFSGPMIRNIIRYNVSQNDGRTGGYGGISMYANGTWGSVPPPGDWIEDTEIYNNTVYSSPPAIAAVEFIANCYAVKNVRIYNNIFYNAGMSSFVDGPYGYDDGSNVFRNNDYYNSSGTFRAYWEGYYYFSLSSWRGSGSSAQEMLGPQALGFSVNPLLMAPGTGGNVMPAPLNSLTAYMLQPASPMRDAGLALASLLSLTPCPGPQDYYGDSLPQGPAFDLGAHEAPWLSPTPSITANGTFTVTPTPTITPTFTVTPSPTQQVFPTKLAILRHSPAPNPQSGLSCRFTFMATRPLASVEVKVYSPGMVLAAHASCPAASWSPWQQASFFLPELGNGLYYYVLEAVGDDGQRAASDPGRLYVLR